MEIIKRTKRLLRDKPARLSSNRDIQKMARDIAKQAPKPDDSKVVVSFNASTRLTGMSLNAAFGLLTGWSLRLQGVRVVNAVCRRAMARCVLGTDKDDVYKMPPCQSCLQQSSVFFNRSSLLYLDSVESLPLAKDLKDTSLYRLMKFHYEGLPLGELCLPSMRWVLRRHHLIDDEATKVLYRYFILSAYKVAVQFIEVFSQARPDAMLVFNGMQFPEATARWVARQEGIPVVSHEVGLRPLSAFLTLGDATAYPVEISDDFQLSPEQNQRLDEYLSNRFKGNFSMAGVEFWPEMQGLSAELVEKMDAYKQVVPIFTNVIFDTSQPHANVLFKDMFTWLDDVLVVIKAHPETLFVIRAHPDESRPGKASRESVMEWVQKKQVEALENVIFFSPDDYFSSYEMIKRAKFVMIYNSTIGLEASVMGAPVLCAGKARFTQLKTVFFPPSKAAYLQTLSEFLAVDEIHIPDEHRENARRFLFYQLYRTSLPFDRFIEPDNIWPGYVKLKEFTWQDLLPENSTTLRVITEGLLGGKDFLLPEA
jgi:hypothetical protein